LLIFSSLLDSKHKRYELRKSSPNQPGLLLRFHEVVTH
jgi:hypothetical protein